MIGDGLQGFEQRRCIMCGLLVAGDLQNPVRAAILWFEQSCRGGSAPELASPFYLSVGPTG